MRRPFRIYIAGPCTGIPNENKPAFLSAELQLRGMGCDVVVNPTTIPEQAHHDQTLESFMRVCLPALCTCDAVALLPGWEQSKGACVEVDLARTLGLDVRNLGDWLLKPDHAFRVDADGWCGLCPASNRDACRCDPDGCADSSCPGRAMVQHLPDDDTEGGAA